MESKYELIIIDQNLKYINSNANLINIKSAYILKIIFNDLKQNRSLKIIKISKKIQNRLNITIKHYKEYSKIRIFSPIEIEVIPAKKTSGHYIINKKEKDSYYHIYFNDNKEEAKNSFFTENDNVSKIRIIIDYQVTSFYNLFNNCDYIKSIRFKKFDRNNIDNMCCMFYSCSSLEELDISNFKSDNVTDMSYMFYECSSLKHINGYSLNTKNLINANCMFNGCSSLKNLNLSMFNNKNNINMKCMLKGCSSLKELNINIFNKNFLIDMSYIFSGCTSLKKINIPNFNSINISNMRGMFHECSNDLKNKIRKKFKRIPYDGFI